MAKQGKLYHRRQAAAVKKGKGSRFAPMMDPLGPPDKNGVRKRVPRTIVRNAKLERDFRV